MRGTVKKLVKEKGFGFLKKDGPGDVFFHASVVAEPGFDALEMGDLVDFEMKMEERGPKASRVEKVRR